MFENSSLTAYAEVLATADGKQLLTTLTTVIISSLCCSLACALVGFYYLAVCHKKFGIYPISRKRRSLAEKICRSSKSENACDDGDISLYSSAWILGGSKTDPASCSRSGTVNTHEFCRNPTCDECFYNPTSESYVRNLEVKYSSYSQRPQDIFIKKTPQVSESKPKEINLSYSRLTTCPARIGFIGSQLVVLDLSHNQLAKLPPEIGCLLGLEELCLGNNILEDLPYSIGSLKRLTDLDLTNNSLAILPTCIGNLLSLKYLGLHGNDISTLPKSIGQLRDLEKLLVGSNSLISLPHEICHLSHLHTLEISQNVGLTQLPDRIGDLRSLQVLDAKGCQLTSLPISFVRCSSLSFLYLANNKLRMVPTQLGKLHQLMELEVQGNRLPYIPATATSLRWLRKFTAFPNPYIKISGNIKEDQFIPAHPSLLEICAQFILSQNIPWSNCGLPHALKELLRQTENCVCCDRNLLRRRCLRRAEMGQVGNEIVPIYQAICPLNSRLFCRFLAIKRP